MPQITRLHKPSPHFSEIVLAFSHVPPRCRAVVAVALMRFATDLGCDDGARGFAVVLEGILTDLNEGRPLAEITTAVDGIEERTVDGSLAWIVKEVDEKEKGNNTL